VVPCRKLVVFTQGGDEKGGSDIDFGIMAFGPEPYFPFNKSE